jgi:RNA polymerase sigma factor (sigma-70 family)
MAPLIDATSEGQYSAMEVLSGSGQQRDFSDFTPRLAAARPRLQRLAHLRGVAPDAVEDVVQETLLEAWQHLDRLRTAEGFSAWLDEICRNMCRRHVRKQSIAQRHAMLVLPPYHGNDTEGASTASPVLRNIPDPHSDDPLEALSRQDVATLLDRALGTLSRDAQQIVELCYLLQLPQREVAARLGISVSALEARLHRARHQLRQVLNGPLRADAEALDLSLDQEYAHGWRETRLWCALCGKHRLMGMFLPQLDGGANLHMRCPGCEQRSGLTDIDNSNVHSKGLIRLDGLTSFRPAWKRTMQGMTQRFMQALHTGERRCPYCGAPASLQLVDKATAESTAGTALPAGLSRHPYQYWVWWKCARCHYASTADVGVFAASDLVYWSHAQTRQFMGDHPRWVSEPELLVEYAGQPAIRFQMADVTSSARLTVLAHRQALHVLATFL